MKPTHFWAKPIFVVAVILVYLAIHFSIRMAQGPALGTDDAEQALFAQHFAWSYRYRAPPLFTWLLTALGHLMPVGVVALSLLRYALLGTTYIFTYLTARRLISDPRLAALAVYSFAAIHTFSESSHRELTHTTTLAAFIALAWYVFVRLSEAPRLQWYLALGATFGLGILAKWNFVVLAMTLPIACLLRRGFRPLVLTWQALPAALLAAVIVLPTVVSTLGSGTPAGEDVQSVFSADERGLGQIARGTFSLIEAMIVYPEPFLPIFLVILGLPLWRGIRAAGPQSVSPFRPDIVFVGTTIAIGLLLLWLIVPIVAATEFKVRYMYPALFILPTFLCMLVERGRPADRALQLLALVLLVPAIQVPIERLGSGFSDNCGLCLEGAPFGRLAADLTSAGYNGSGTLITNSVYSGGNLRVQFPRARIMDPAFPPTSWPAASDDGPCLLVWQESADNSFPRSVPAAQIAYLADVMHGDPQAPHRDGEVSANFSSRDMRPLRLGYRLYEHPVGECR